MRKFPFKSDSASMVYARILSRCADDDESGDEIDKKISRILNGIARLCRQRRTRQKKCNIEKIGKIPGISRISGTGEKKICILSFHNDKNENPSSELPPRLIIRTSFVHFLECTFASHNNQRVARACTYTCPAILTVHIRQFTCVFSVYILHSISSISSNTATTPIYDRKNPKLPFS